MRERADSIFFSPKHITTTPRQEFVGLGSLGIQHQDYWTRANQTRCDRQSKITSFKKGKERKKDSRRAGVCVCVRHIACDTGGACGMIGMKHVSGLPYPFLDQLE